ncbi:MAG: hypothetical protein HQL47_03590 [Gammaproteobacteria bacterium]|nr:hypothetical protein [Gammaproteobacteria bacterium]
MRKLLMFGCNQMREGIAFSFAFFAAGGIMMLAGLLLIPSVASINHIFTVIGMVLFFVAPLILVSTFLLTVIPGLRKYTDECD